MWANDRAWRAWIAWNEKPDDANNFMKGFAHILNLSFIAHVTFYFQIWLLI